MQTGQGQGASRRTAPKARSGGTAGVPHPSPHRSAGRQPAVIEEMLYKYIVGDFESCCSQGGAGRATRGYDAQVALKKVEHVPPGPDHNPDKPAP